MSTSTSDSRVRVTGAAVAWTVLWPLGLIWILPSRAPRAVKLAAVILPIVAGLSSLFPLLLVLQPGGLSQCSGRYCSYLPPHTSTGATFGTSTLLTGTVACVAAYVAYIVVVAIAARAILGSRPRWASARLRTL